MLMPDAPTNLDGVERGGPREAAKGWRLRGKGCAPAGGGGRPMCRGPPPEHDALLHLPLPPPLAPPPAPPPPPRPPPPPPPAAPPPAGRRGRLGTELRAAARRAAAAAGTRAPR